MAWLRAVEALLKKLNPKHRLAADGAGGIRGGENPFQPGTFWPGMGLLARTPSPLAQGTSISRRSEKLVGRALASGGSVDGGNFRAGLKEVYWALGVSLSVVTVLVFCVCCSAGGFSRTPFFYLCFFEIEPDNGLPSLLLMGTPGPRPWSGPTV